MFQVCSKLTFRKIRCSAKITDVHFLTFKLVITAQTMLTITMKYFNRTMEKCLDKVCITYDQKVNIY
jgi:hypothetical protein